MREQINIAIVDDHNLFRKGLIKLINLSNKDDRFNILFEAENGIDLQNKLSIKKLPDIVLMDIDMPDMDGYEAVAWLRKFYPHIKILVVSMFMKPQAIDRMIQLGVKGYLSKDIEVEDMHKALNTIVNNGLYYAETIPDILSCYAEQLTDSDDVLNKQWNGLSENEREFTRLACTEYTYKEIANKMGLSPKTIDGYRENLFEKFNVKSRVGLAMYAVRNKLVNA